jgi:NitT/TauT family transport system substrate-binding protein
MLGLIVLLQTLTLALGGPAGSLEYLPIRLAEVEGDFAREGLTVRIKRTRAESGAAEALSQGQVDLAATSFEAMLRFGPRTPAQMPRIVVGLTAAPPVAVLVARDQARSVGAVEDLAGHRVGVATPGAPEHAWFGWLVARAGLSVAQVGVISVGTRGLETALASGDIHVALAPEPLASRLLAAGQAGVLADFRTPETARRAIGAPTVNAAVFIRADRRPRDQDLTAFARALGRAVERLQTGHHDTLIARLGRDLLGSSDAERVLAAARTVYLPRGLVTAEQVQETITVIRSHTPLPASLRLPRPAELLHLEPLRRAREAPPSR